MLDTRQCSRVCVLGATLNPGSEFRGHSQKTKSETCMQSTHPYLLSCSSSPTALSVTEAASTGVLLALAHRATAKASDFETKHSQE